MTVKEIVEILDGTIVYGEDFLDREVFKACGSDMMSDVLAYVKEQAVLLTGLVNPQVVRTAEMMDMKCIVFVRGKSPDMGMIDLAEERDLRGRQSEGRGVLMPIAAGMMDTRHMSRHRGGWGRTDTAHMPMPGAECRSPPSL